MLNQLARYGPVVSLIEESPGSTVLEVGSGHRGVTRFLARRWQITASDVDFTDYGTAAEENGSERVERVRADVCALPFADMAFDVVVAVDVLEHVRPEQRRLALNELVRVTRRRLIVAVPSGRQALESDRRLAGFYRRLGLDVPVWLDEHLERGFPEEADLHRALAPHGRLRLLPNEWVRSHAVVGRLEALPQINLLSPFLSRHLERAVGGETGWGARVGAAVLRGLRAWDRRPSYRTIAVLDRVDAT
jgi:SAM-dependent methyltransferase